MNPATQTAPTKNVVMVTGVAGFIGSTIANQLLSQGFEVIGVDDLSLGRLEKVPKHVRFINADVSKPEQLEALEDSNIRCIIHMAGQSGGELSFSETLYDLDSNVRSTVSLIEFARSRGIQKIVHASSVAVYGEQQMKRLGIPEDARLQPTSPYGVSKMTAEKYLELLTPRYGITSTSLRFFNIYGAGQDLTRLNQGMLSIFLSQALSSGDILVKGSLERFRDFVHVYDASAAALAAMKLNHSGHRSFNVCSGVKTEVAKAIEILQDEFDNDLQVSTGQSTPGDVSGWVGNPSRIEQELSWRPAINFESGFRTMISDEIKHDRSIKKRRPRE